MTEFRYVPVVLLLVAAIVLSTRKGDVPLALRGLRKMLGQSTPKPAKCEPRNAKREFWRRFVAFLCVLLAFALCVA